MQLANKTGLPIKILENWLGNSRKKARKIAREGGQLPTQPITKRSAARDTAHSRHTYRGDALPPTARCAQSPLILPVQ